MKKQQFKNDLSSLHKRCKILVKIMKKMKMKKIQKKSTDQIFQKIESVSTAQ